jgi:hypothetical protein
MVVFVGDGAEDMVDRNSKIKKAKRKNLGE